MSTHKGVNTLQAGSSHSDVATVQLLINSGADINTQGDHFGSALQETSVEAAVEVVNPQVELMDEDYTENCIRPALDFEPPDGHYAVQGGVKSTHYSGNAMFAEPSFKRALKDSDDDDDREWKRLRSRSQIPD
jgi:hypothetical protein